MAQQQQQVQHHALPGWFVGFQDTAGLSLLLIALMGINGVVYASGVVKDIERPQSWGLFGTILFVLFFAAGAAMPGVALRAGANMFVGEWYRRLACLFVSVFFFVLEVWCSITERSLNTATSPADRWLMSAIGQPNLPFSPTVIAIALGISLVVIVWGLVTGVRAIEDADDVRRREELKTIQAEAKATRARIYGGALGGLGRAVYQAATGKDDATKDEQIPDGNAGDDDGPDGPAAAGNVASVSEPKAQRPRLLRSAEDPLRGRITAAQLADWVRESLGVTISAETALQFLKALPGSGPTKGMQGTPVSASKALALARAKAKWGAQPEGQASGA